MHFLALRILILAVLAIYVAAAGGKMYDSDHWQYSTKLTTSNFDSVIKENVDAGKTIFVRWIASEG
jgi:hypothetical protein